MGKGVDVETSLVIAISIKNCWVRFFDRAALDVPVQPALRNGFKMYRFTDRYLFPGTPSPSLALHARMPSWGSALPAKGS